jgi:hypothetical protein
MSVIWKNRVITSLENLIGKDSYDIVNDYCDKRMQSVFYQNEKRMSKKCESVYKV